MGFLSSTISMIKWKIAIWPFQAAEWSGQWSPTIAVFGIVVLNIFHDQLANSHMTLPGSRMEWSPSIAVFGIFVPHIFCDQLANSHMTILYCKTINMLALRVWQDWRGHGVASGLDIWGHCYCDIPSTRTMYVTKEDKSIVSIGVDSGVSGSDGHIYLANLGNKCFWGVAIRTLGWILGVRVRFLKIWSILAFLFNWPSWALAFLLNWPSWVLAFWVLPFW